MAIKLGATSVTGAYVGTTAISKMYLGNTQVLGTSVSPTHQIWSNTAEFAYDWQNAGGSFNDSQPSTMLGQLFAVYFGAGSIPATSWRLRKIRFYLNAQAQAAMVGDTAVFHVWTSIDRSGPYLNSPGGGNPPVWSSSPVTLAYKWNEITLPSPITLPMSNTALIGTENGAYQFGVAIQTTAEYQAITSQGFVTPKYAEDGAALITGDLWVGNRFGWFLYPGGAGTNDWINYYTGLDVVVDEG